MISNEPVETFNSTNLNNEQLDNDDLILLKNEINLLHLCTFKTPIFYSIFFINSNTCLCFFVSKCFL
jgi:hypothetical protein